VRLLLGHPGRIGKLLKRRMDVTCKRCKWRGYRVVKVMLAAERRMDVAAATMKIKGMRSLPNCLICNGHSE
jgi:hypothetical protein